MKKPSLTKKSEWMQYFEKEKSIALELVRKINEVDRIIDQSVYLFYKLTPGEVELIDQAT